MSKCGRKRLNTVDIAKCGPNWLNAVEIIKMLAINTKVARNYLSYKFMEKKTGKPVINISPLFFAIKNYQSSPPHAFPNCARLSFPIHARHK